MARTMTDDQCEAMARSFVDNELMKQTAAYVARGRWLEQHSDPAILDIWVATFKNWFKHRTNETANDHDDADAELRLRRLHPPHDRVKEILEAMRREAERIDENRPPKDLAQRVDAFLADLRGARH
jgi:hypothetical protein